MKDKIDLLDVFLKELLLGDVSILNCDKILRSGKLVMFSHGNFAINLNLELKNGKTSNLRLPYPFDLEIDDLSAVFDYRISTLTNANPALSDIIKAMTIRTPSKYMGLIVEIRGN